MTEWALTSSVLIVVVLLLRQCLKGRISLRLQYGLWALVLVRLLLPISLGHTPVSVLNAVEEAPLTQVVTFVGDGPDLAVAEPDPALPSEQQQELYEENLQQGPEEMEKSGTLVHLNHVLLLVWGVGAVAVALWLAGVNLHFARLLRRSRRALAVEDCPLPVYVSQAIPTPCLFGLVRPCIYVTPLTASDETLLRHTLTHELTHYRHRDYLWSALRSVCLALHWYNPLVWLAAVVSSRDGELCCDEATVAQLGEGERAAYGRTLLAVTCQGRGNLLLTATSMTGRGRDIKERILLLTKRPKTAALTLAAVMLVAAVAAGCTFTGPAPTTTPDPAPNENTPQALTQEELDRYDQLFNPIQYSSDGTQVSNPLCSFFTSYYDRPEDLDLEQFLRYFPDDGVVAEGDITQQETNAELQALQAHPLWPFGSATFIPQPIHRYTRETVDQVLEQYAGITTRDLTVVESDDLIYLEEYDAWYNFTSDFAAGLFPCNYGTRTGNQVTLYSSPNETATRSVLVLEETSDGFHILSHQLEKK